MPPLPYLVPLTAAGLALLPLGVIAKTPAAPDKEEQAAGVTKVLVQVIPNLVKFDTTEFEVPAGSPVELTFKNGCVMPHNLVILPKTAESIVVNAVNALGAEGFEKGFIPPVPEILVASKLLPAGGSQVIKFKAPEKPGEYLYVCTFPGHWFTMRGIMQVRAKGEKLAKAKREVSNEVKVPDALKDSGVTHTPLGKLEKPLIMRTFLPDPGLDDAVFAHHGTSKAAKKYDPATRQDILEAPAKADSKDAKKPLVVNPEAGIPGAIAVSHGPDFAYAWDTTECRLLYAWRGGFLDMNPYWGKEPGTGRAHFYIPTLVGSIVYRASGAAPLSDKNDGAPVFGGYRIVENSPEFFYKLGDRTIRERVIPKASGGFDIAVQVEGGKGAPAWKVAEKDAPAVKVESAGSGQLTVHVTDRKEEAKAAGKPASATRTDNE